MSFPAAAFGFVAAGCVFLVVPVAFTAIGASRRGHRLLFCLASGVVFPVTWAVWYVNDDRAPGAWTNGDMDLVLEPDARRQAIAISISGARPIVGAGIVSR